MFFNTQTQRTFISSTLDESVESWIEAFLVDRKSRGNASGTLGFYNQKLKTFLDYCDTQLVKNISQISPDLIRKFLLQLQNDQHNAGGIHAEYRALRAFLLWFEQEVEPAGWSNPILKVKAPKVPKVIIDPVPLDVVSKMMKTCKPNTFTGERDLALQLFYLDTGVRALEGLSIDLPDVNLPKGEILIRQGKGKKPRFVYICKQTRKAIRKYLSLRKDSNPALWVIHPRFGSGRLSYDGLRGIISRRAQLAGCETPSIHDYRRAYAISMLRSGVDIYTIAKSLGHEGISVLQYYLKQTNQDIKMAHLVASPVESNTHILH